MLNYIWAFMILIGITVGAFNGNMGKVSTETLNSSKEAVTLCITMLGVMSLWTGLMNVARGCGLMDKLTHLMKPVIRFLYPSIPEKHKANEYIAANMVANLLGLGWAATPVGIKAIKELCDMEKKKTGNYDGCRPTIDMCTFLIVNMSSLQLIPVNIIAYRSQYGSANPASIIAPAIIATTCSTIAGVVFAKVAAYMVNKKDLRSRNLVK